MKKFTSKKYIAVIVMAIFMLIVGKRFLGPKTDNQQEVQYGKIERIFGDDISMQKLNDDEKAQINRKIALKKSMQRDLFFEKEVEPVTTKDETYDVYNTKYVKRDNNIVVNFYILNLTDNRKKEVTVTVYNKLKEVIGEKTIYQNSLAKPKVNIRMDVKLKKGYFGSDVDKIEIKAKEIKEDMLPY